MPTGCQTQPLSTIPPRPARRPARRGSSPGRARAAPLPADRRSVSGRSAVRRSWGRRRPAGSSRSRGPAVSAVDLGEGGGEVRVLDVVVAPVQPHRLPPRLQVEDDPAPSPGPRRPPPSRPRARRGATRPGRARRPHRRRSSAAGPSPGRDRPGRCRRSSASTTHSDRCGGADGLDVCDPPGDAPRQVDLFVAERQAGCPFRTWGRPMRASWSHSQQPPFSIWANRSGETGRRFPSIGSGSARQSGQTRAYSVPTPLNALA